MMSRRTIVKSIALILILGIAGAYWYYAERRSSPLEEVQREVQKIVDPVLSPTLGDLAPALITVPEELRSGVFASPRSVTVPEGWGVKLFATGLGKARFMAWDEGAKTLYVTVRDRGEVVALPDADGDRAADRAVVRARGLTNPNGIAVGDAGILVADTDHLVRLNETGTEVERLARLPYRGDHYTRTILIDPHDASLVYVSVGSTCNACQDSPQHAAILTYRIGGERSEPRLYARGLRNSVGMTWRPGTDELWATDNGRDWLGDDLPPDEVNIVRPGGDYGWPYCYGNRAPDPDYGSVDRCLETVPATIELPAHSAALGLRFYEKRTESEAARALHGSLLIAYHGSWNRSVPTGYKVVRAVERGGRWEVSDFMTGFHDGKAPWARPVDVLEGPAGELYVSDDLSGSIFVLTPP